MNDQERDDRDRGDGVVWGVIGGVVVVLFLLGAVALVSFVGFRSQAVLIETERQAAVEAEERARYDAEKARIEWEGAQGEPPTQPGNPEPRANLQPNSLPSSPE